MKIPCPSHKNYIKESPKLNEGEEFLENFDVMSNFEENIFKLHYYKKAPKKDILKWKKKILIFIRKLAIYHDKSPFHQGYLILKLWDEPLSGTLDLKRIENCIQHSLSKNEVLFYSQIKIKSKGTDPLLFRSWIWSIIEHIVDGMDLDDNLTIPSKSPKGVSLTEARRFLTARKNDFRKYRMNVVKFYYNQNKQFADLLDPIKEIRQFTEELREIHHNKSGNPRNFSDGDLRCALWECDLAVNNFKLYLNVVRGYLKSKGDESYRMIRYSEKHRKNLMAISNHLTNTIIENKSIFWRLMIYKKELILPFPLKEE